MMARARACELVSGSSRKDWGTLLSVRMKSPAVSENTVSPTLVLTSTGTSTKFERTLRGAACEAGCLSELSDDCSPVWAKTVATQEDPSKSTPARTAFDRLDIPSPACRDQLPACETHSITALMLLLLCPSRKMGNRLPGRQSPRN